MAVFSTNQARQLYVVNLIKTELWDGTENAGTIKAVSDKGADNSQADKYGYFQYKGADTVLRSDLINVDSILDARVTFAEEMAYDKKSVQVSLSSDVNGGEPVPGQDYILRLIFRQYVGMSDEDQYQKYGMVHAHSSMDASDFYKTLAISLAKNFSREVVPLIKIELLGDLSAKTEVLPTTTKDSLTGNYTGVVITEVEQPWRLGVMAQTPVYFEVQSVPVRVDGDDLHWAEFTWSTNGTIENGKKIADLEYFCMGERGDVYRGMNWPHNIPTTYLVDPSKKYNVIDIHYAYQGSNEAVQKSEKTLTLVFDADNSTLTAASTGVIGMVNTLFGLTLPETHEDKFPTEEEEGD